MRHIAHQNTSGDLIKRSYQVSKSCGHSTG